MFKENAIKRIKKLEGYKINCLFNPDTSVIYIGTDKGLVIYGHKTFEVFTQSNGLAANKVNCVARYKNYLVIGTIKGLSLFNLTTRKFSNYYIESGLIDENITALNNQNDQFLSGFSPGIAL